MAPLRYAAKFDPFLFLDYARVETRKGKEWIKFCNLATLPSDPIFLSPHFEGAVPGAGGEGGAVRGALEARHLKYRS